MNTPAAIGRLQARGASLIYQTIGYQTIGATGPSTMPFIFQHGMGGDANQPLGYIGEASPTPVISLNARGHSPSTDINAAAASFDVFADDVIALADHLGLVRFIIGGISLGAGTALNLAVRYPDRVTALVLCRPAWLDRPQAEFNRNAYTEIADLLDRYPAEDAAKRYPQTRTYQTVRKGSPAAAASLLGQLTRPRAAQNSVILCTFPGSSPTKSTDTWRALDIPTLVIGHHDDPFHPYEIARAHTDTIPGAPCAPSPAKTPTLHASPPTSKPRSTTSFANCEHNVTVSTDQPSARPRPQPGHIYVVVDLGGTQTRTAIFDPTGQMLTRRAVATPRTGGPDEVIAAVLSQIREATAQHRATVVAVGVSALGPVDPNTGIIHSAPTLPGFDNVPLGPRLHDAPQLPVHVHNDANAATIAEWQLGAGRGTRHFCYVTVSTGMGCGIIS
ncbi:MAG: ROK family protein, partial [Propionibacteriaceae bacterium]